MAYDGTDFRGFARQPGQRTVQGTLEEALSRVLGTVPRLSVAGRTDAGVHAEGQVVSFDADADPQRVQRAVNGMLGPEVVVVRAARAPAGFDARRSATAREYRYRVRAGAVANPFTARYEWHRPGEYGLVPMRRAARSLEGEHDFASFCRAVKEPASTVRTLDRLTVGRRDEVVEVRARADSFLHQMVRSLVGTLVVVGEGRMEPEAMTEVLRARSRAAAGAVAPPHGLTLVRVVYGWRPSRPAETPERGGPS
ncbi:MAG TPA: tRNA pseudouridine(38-40) synthase TruA [Actinomycetota bacterium]|nr:tRNA pseudouridine(38-40) synthase TruA [Actinomycetota bacterium]